MMELIFLLIIVLVTAGGMGYTMSVKMGREQEGIISLLELDLYEEEDGKSELYFTYIGELELPVCNATGYAICSLELKETASNQSPSRGRIKQGEAFCILKEDQEWWLVTNENNHGWIEHDYCMINLPDVVPSIVYDITNMYHCKYKFFENRIPGITGEKLYGGKVYNERLNSKEFIVPIMYSTAIKICKAQQIALENGYSLKIYEAFRSLGVQIMIRDAFRGMLENNGDISSDNSSSWIGKEFPEDKLSVHQKGTAIDVSLVRVDSIQELYSGDYEYIKVTEYLDCKEKTEIYEWRANIREIDEDEEACVLCEYLSEAGMQSVSLKWWHFEDEEGNQKLGKGMFSGNFYPYKCYSTSPD